MLADFLQAVLDIPPEDYDTLTIIDPNVKRETPDDKAGVLDVKLKTKSGKIIDIEIQVDSYIPMRERIAYYVSKMVTEQIGRGQEYGVIKRVISVVITDFVVVVDSPDYHHTFHWHDAKHNITLTDLVEIHTLELPKLPVHQDGSKLWSWLKLFNTQKEEDLTMLAEQKPMIRKVVGILQELSQDEQTRLLYEQQEKWRMDRAASMRNAKQIGLREGMDKGRQEGKLEGRAEGIRETAKKMKADGLSASMIATYTNLSVEEIETL
ncbi:transposase [Planctomycetales bacterium]|nr:transposase [Planctomycetales bacterium]